MKINVDLLKDYRSDFSNEKSNFNSSSYGTFSSSYINRCSDSYIIRMKNELRKLYQDIEKAYKNIDSWWGDYNNDIESLERALSNDGRSGAIKASSVRSSVDVLPTLKNYSLSFSGIINLNFEKAIPTLDLENQNLVFSNNIHDDFSNRTNVIDSFFSFFLSDTGAVISEGWNWFGDKALDSIDYISNIGNETYNWFNDEALPWFQNAASTVWDVVESVGATITIFCQSLVEGILQLGEAIIDFAVLASVGVSSAVTGLIDGGQAIYGAITGNEWASVTKEMWKDTMGFVSNQYVTGWFDSLYQNTGYGKWLSENAYWFDNVRSVGSGIGYVAGIVVLTIATLGAGSAVVAGGSATASTAATTTHMAVTATVAGIGKGTQDTWADGAGLLEGLTAGIVTGLWEGLQFYVGGKIGGLEIFGADGFLKSIGSSKIGTKILNGLARVILDGLDGGVEGFVQPLISGIYQDGYYDNEGNYIEFTENDNFLKRYAELFDDAGGLANVGIQTLIGGGSSLIGEAFDLSKILRESNDVDIGEKINVDVNNSNPKLPEMISVKANIDGSTKLMDTSKLLKTLQNWDEFNKFLHFKEYKDLFQDGTKDEYILAIRQMMELAEKNKMDLGLDDVQLKLIKDYESLDLYEYSNYPIIRMFDEVGNYREVCNIFLELSIDGDMRTKLEDILFTGRYKDFVVSSNLTRGDPFKEAEKRLAVANLLINNPETFDILAANKVNMFHGTKSVNLSNISKYGLYSGKGLEELGLEILTGEKWSRIGGKQRDFVSFTDNLDIAKSYTSLSSSPESFSVIIGTTETDILHAGSARIGSDLPEIGVKNRLSLESIKVIGVPTDKVSYVKDLVNNDRVAVVAIDIVEDDNFFYADDFLSRIHIDKDKVNGLKAKFASMKSANSTQSLTLDDLKYNQVNSLTSAKALLESNIRRYVYTDTNNFEGLNQSIINSGLYHFTDAADAILESGYIKATGEISLGSFGYIDPGLLGYLNSKSYGNAKAFFFAGVPEVGAFATNLDTIPLRTTAIKVQPNFDIVNSSKLKIRNLDDGAITYDGRFDLTGSQASKEYFCLFKENDKLVYKPVSKDVFDNYENTAEGKVLADFLKIKKNVKTIKDDYLVGLSMKNTNAKIGTTSSIISGIENLDTPHYLNDGFEVADYFNDPKQYLFQKLKSLAETSNDSSFLEKYKELVKKDPRTINEPRFNGKGMKLATVDISEDELFDFLNSKGVFTEQDYEIYRRLKNNEVKFSQTEKDAIFIFTAWFGPELAAYNRNAVTNFDGHRIDGMNRLQIEHHLNNQIDLYNRVYGKNIPHMELDEFNSIMDKITQRSVLEEDLVVYRGANSLFSDGGELDFESIKPGQTFNDKSHISTSVIPTNMVNKHKYILEIKLPKDTSFGYIETVTGVARYGQQELLLGRNNNFKITDYPEIVEMDGVEHYKVKVELVPSVLEPDLDITVELEPPTVELDPHTVELELPNSNLETLDITQPLDAKVNILDNNQISEEMRAKILDDFKKMMRNGKRSNYELLEMVMEMAGKKGDDGFRILQAITRIKSIIPELEFSANAYEDGSWWRYDSFNDECKLQLQERYIDWKNYETLAHELGHCLFDMISGAPLPDNWADMIVRTKINSSNNGTLKLFKQEYDILKRDIYWNQAYPKFKDSIMIQYGYTEKQYREFLTEQFKQISQDRAKLRQTLIDSGLTFEQAFKMTNEDIDIEKLVDDDIKRQISNFNNQIWRTQYGGYVALNDMIDAVSNGDWGDVYGGYSHGSKYYLDAPENFPLHELVANFTSLKLNNEEAALKQFKEIFGTELYDYLDSIYNSFLEFGKRYGGV